jgi:hypothetical protein
MEAGRPVAALAAHHAPAGAPRAVERQLEKVGELPHEVVDLGQAVDWAAAARRGMFAQEAGVRHRPRGPFRPELLRRKGRGGARSATDSILI